MSAQPHGQPLSDDPVPEVVIRARAVEAGISDRELASDLWCGHLQGVHVRADADRMGPLLRSAAVAAVLPQGAALGGWAAAYRLGVTDLDGLGANGSTLLPVPVCLQPTTQMRRRPQIHPMRSAFTDEDLVQLDGVPVTSPERTCFDLMRAPVLPMGPAVPILELEEAVVGVDAMLRAGLVSVASMRQYVDRRPRWRGVPLARRALDLADGRSRSCPESRFRVLWTVEAGLAGPLVNHPVCDPAGELLGIPDLLDPEAALVGEYDGQHHRDLAQHTADNVREEIFEEHGLLVVRASSSDLTAYRRRTVRRVQSGHRRGVTRDRRRDHWRLLRTPS